MDVLTGNLLRRAVAPIRTHSPATFEALRRVRDRLIGGGSEAPAHQRIAVARFQEHCPDRGRILEIGAALDLSTLRMLSAQNPDATEVVGVNKDKGFWSSQPESSIVEDRFRLLDVDAGDLPFEAGSFDAVFSVATFEHLGDLPTVLAEIRRVLRPGGRAYAHYGPIWSSGKGHHVNASVNGEVARHSDPSTNPIPDFAHLLLGRDELQEGLLRCVSEPLAEAVLFRVYDTPSINRLFDHEYVEAFRDSGMRLVHSRVDRDPVPAPILRLLRFRYGSVPDFGVTNGEVVLER